MQLVYFTAPADWAVVNEAFYHGVIVSKVVIVDSNELQLKNKATGNIDEKNTSQN